MDLILATSQERETWMTRYELRQESCINSGNCVEIAPRLFSMDDDGVVSGP